MPRFNEKDPDTFFALARVAEVRGRPDSEKTLLQCVFTDEAQICFLPLVLLKVVIMLKLKVPLKGAC